MKVPWCSRRRFTALKLVCDPPVNTKKSPTCRCRCWWFLQFQRKTTYLQHMFHRGSRRKDDLWQVLTQHFLLELWSLSYPRGCWQASDCCSRLSVKPLDICNEETRLTPAEQFLAVFSAHLASWKPNQVSQSKMWILVPKPNQTTSRALSQHIPGFQKCSLPTLILESRLFLLVSQ